MKENLRETLTSSKRFYGFKYTDLFGIALMIIPFILSFSKYSYLKPIISIGNLAIGQKEIVLDIKPRYVSALLAVLLYGSFILRYDFFRKDTLLEGIISSIRTLLNVWVIAAIIMTIMPTKYPKNATTIQIFSSVPTLVFAAIILTWVGMRTLAGYSWILLIIAGWKNILQVNNAMNTNGAIFIIVFAISMFLQIDDYNDLRDFLEDFRGKATRYSSNVRDDINAAAQDAAQKAAGAAEFVKKAAGMKGSSAENKKEQPDTEKKSVEINLDSLDVNHDGVVDEKDFAILAKHKRNEEES